MIIHQKLVALHVDEGVKERENYSMDVHETCRKKLVHDTKYTVHGMVAYHHTRPLGA